MNDYKLKSCYQAKKFCNEFKNKYNNKYSIYYKYDDFDNSTTIIYQEFKTNINELNSFIGSLLIKYFYSEHIYNISVIKESQYDYKYFQEEYDINMPYYKCKDNKKLYNYFTKWRIKRKLQNSIERLK